MQNKITSGTSATNLTPKNKVDVDVTFDPPWNPEMMSDEARSKLGFETVTATVKEPKVNVEWE